MNAACRHRIFNDPVKDPDWWSGVSPRWRLPLQWATVDLMYAVVILREWAQVTTRERVQIIVITGGLFAGYGLSWVYGFGMEATLYWLLPSRIAVTWLGTPVVPLLKLS